MIKRNENDTRTSKAQAIAKPKQSPKTSCLNNEKISNSISPSIKEIERFISYLNKRFSLELPLSDLTILINTTHPNTKGYFSPKNYKKGFENTTKKLNAICLSAYYLKQTPYETIAHETAHFINEVLGIEDCKSNQYHNKHFKRQAEKLFLLVERTSRGYALTSETPEFKQMIKDFKPNENAFKIKQRLSKDDDTQTTRLTKYICSCEKPFIIRCPSLKRELKATCDLCNKPFERVLK